MTPYLPRAGRGTASALQPSCIDSVTAPRWWCWIPAFGIIPLRHKPATDGAKQTL